MTSTIWAEVMSAVLARASRPWPGGRVRRTCWTKDALAYDLQSVGIRRVEARGRTASFIVDSFAAVL
jgi:hypothetical protein